MNYKIWYRFWDKDWYMCTAYIEVQNKEEEKKAEERLARDLERKNCELINVFAREF